jgi:hypothetical protein
MKGLAERIAGRDSVSGSIVKIGVLGKAPAGDDTNLLNIQITMDSGCSVFLVSSQSGVELMLERVERTATFVGEFIGCGRNSLCCDEVYFWGDVDEV